MKTLEQVIAEALADDGMHAKIAELMAPEVAVAVRAWLEEHDGDQVLGAEEATA